MTADFRPFDPLVVPLDRTVVVEASAGTGKTYSITLLYLRCVLERGLDPSRILVVTFTRAATAELRKRIREGLAEASESLRSDGAILLDPAKESLLARYRGPQRDDALLKLASALDSLDRASIFTIDGFLGRILRQRAFEIGQPFEFEAGVDGKAILAKIAADRFTTDYATLDVEQLAASAYADPDAIASLLSLATSYPTLPIEPPRITDDDFVDAESQFVRARSRYLRAREESGSDADVLAVAKNVRARISTVHALGEFDAIAGGRRAPTPTLPKNWEYLSGRSYRELAAGAKAEPSAVFDAVDDLVDAIGAVVPARIAHEAHALVDRGRRDHERATRGEGVLTFDALKVAVHALLVSAEHGERLSAVIAEEYAVALVDESQDTDASQFEVFQRIFARPDRGLVFIGDPKQAIYGFRGADIHAYLAARESASLRLTMTRNFRSRPELVDALDALYLRAPGAFGTDAIDYVPVKAAREAESFPAVVEDRETHAVEVLHGAPKSDPHELVATDIVRTLERGSFVDAEGIATPIRPMSIAVLCKSNGSVDAICRALRIRGVPAVAASNRTVFRSDEASDFALFLRAVLDPSSGRALRAALLTPLFDHDPRSLHRLSSDDVAWGRIVDEFSLIRDELHAKGIGYAFARFARAAGLEARLLARPDGYRYVTNVTHLVELLSRAASEKKLGAEGLLSMLERARSGEDLDAAATEERSLRLEHAGDAVEVVTIHKSKGLEYDLVYLVDLWKPPRAASRRGPSLVRHPTRGRLVALELGLDEELVTALEHERSGEDARLTYVALTRAKLAVRIVAIEKPAQKESIRSGFGTTRLGLVLGGELDEGAAADGAEYFAALERRFAELRSRDGISVGIRSVDASTPRTSFVPRVAPPLLLAPVEATRRFERVARTSSFSGLVAGAESLRPADRDLDATRDASVAIGSDPLEGVPRGRELGVLVHEALELVDFDATEDAIAVAVDHALASASAFAPHRSSLVAVIQNTLATQLFERGPRLSDVPRGRTLRELEFQISVRNRDGFTPQLLARLFTEHGIPSPDSGYGDRIAKLPFASLTGYLRGFVDLVFEHEGRFHVVDYKSNHLGAPAEYESARLLAPMIDHHYVLQYAVYVLALHRLLRQRLRDYDYDRHVGGSLYLFLRGMSPARGAASGVFEQRLPKTFVQALDRLFEGGAA